MPRSDAEITLFEKSGGPLTKRISLAPDGSVKSDAQCLRDGARCGAAAARCRRWRARGCHREDPARSGYRTRRSARRPARQGPGRHQAQTSTVSPTPLPAPLLTSITERSEPAWALIDFDAKGMPAEIANEMQRLRRPLADAVVGAAAVTIGRASHPPFDQRRPVPHRYRPEAARVERPARLSVGAGWRRHRALPAHPA